MKDLAGGFGTNQIENVRRNFLPAVRLYFFPPVLLVLYLPSTNKLMNDTILPIALPSIFQSRTPQKNKVRRVVGKRDGHDRNHLSLGGRASVCVLTYRSAPAKSLSFFFPFSSSSAFYLYMCIYVYNRGGEMLYAPRACRLVKGCRWFVIRGRRKRKKMGGRRCK